MLAVAIDLDETLLCVTRTPLSHEPDAVCAHGHIYIRPHALAFLDSLVATTTTGIWSSAPSPYVNEVLNASSLSEIDLAFIWTVRQCGFTDYGTGRIYYSKDTNELRKAFDTDSVLLVDDSPEKIVAHGNDGICVNSFHGDGDDELLMVGRFIERVQNGAGEVAFDKFNWRHLA